MSDVDLDSLFHDRQGRPIPIDVAEKYLRDYGYRRIGLSRVRDMWVSTVWIGVDGSFWPNGDRPPLICETMLFPTVRVRTRPWARELRGHAWRYPNDRTAAIMHERIVRRLKQAGPVRIAREGW